MPFIPIEDGLNTLVTREPKANRVNGQVTQITGADFNSTHRYSAANPSPSPVDSTYCHDIELHWTTWTFQPGHRLRIAISNAQREEVTHMEYDSSTQTRSVVAINEWDEAYPWGTYQNYEKIVHRCPDRDPAHTSVEAEYRLGIQLPDRSIRLETELRFSSDADSFYYHYQRQILEDDILLKAKSWQEHFVRDFQ